MLTDITLYCAVLAIVAGVSGLRLAWSRPHRSVPLNFAAWSLLLAGMVAGWQAAGAWGASIVALWGMGAAFAALAAAAIRARPGKAKPSNRRVGLLPDAGEPRRIAARVLTFVLVGLVSAAFALGVALAFAALSRWAGWSEANANALALFMMPLAWTGIAYAVLMQPGRRGQMKALAVASLPGWPILAAGILS